MNIIPTIDWHYYQTAWFLVSAPVVFILSLFAAALSEVRS